MLICDWATYQHYKNKNQIIHHDLPTVQHSRPVFATTSKFYALFVFYFKHNSKSTICFVASDSNTDEKVITFDEYTFCTIQIKDNSIQ